MVNKSQISLTNNRSIYQSSFLGKSFIFRGGWGDVGGKRWVPPGTGWPILGYIPRSYFDLL